MKGHISDSNGSTWSLLGRNGHGDVYHSAIMGAPSSMTLTHSMNEPCNRLVRVGEMTSDMDVRLLAEAVGAVEHLTTPTFTPDSGLALVVGIVPLAE
jgi:hypothetical protein